MSGPNKLRKLERRYVLTSEYLVKAGYAWLIGQGAESSFDAPKAETLVLAADVPSTLPSGVSRFGDHEQGSLPASHPASLSASLLALPRYGPFGQAAADLARDGARFVEIAGTSEGEAAIAALNGTEHRGRKLNVNEARAQTEGPRRGGGGGGERRRR